MSNRFRQAWDMYKFGARREALSYLFLKAAPEPEEDYILTENPLITDTNWESFLSKIGIPTLSDFIVSKNSDPIVHDELSCVFLEADTKENEPKSTISICSTLWEIGIIIKQDNNTFILDDAYINEIPLQTRSWTPSEPTTNIVPIEDDDHGNEILPHFLKLFSKTATQIYTCDPSITADEIEERLEAKLKPMVRRIVTLERDNIHYRPSTAIDMPQA